MPMTLDESKKLLENAFKSCQTALEMGDPLGYPLAVIKAYEAIGNALDLIQQLETQVPRWISVEERLPERYEHVLVITRFTDDGEPDVEIAYLALNRWQKPEGTLWGKVTHWMPLPEPPTQEGGPKPR